LSEVDLFLPLVFFVLDLLPVPGLGWSFDAGAIFFVFGDDAFESQGKGASEHGEAVVFDVVNVS